MTECLYCSHDIEKDHCKGKQKHTHPWDEAHQGKGMKSVRVQVCKGRHCLVALCCCTDAIEGGEKVDGSKRINDQVSALR